MSGVNVSPPSPTAIRNRLIIMCEHIQRVCFVLRVRPDRLAEYRVRHEAVWPDMLQALGASGWRNYSLFLDDDGMLVGYFETEDLAAAQAAMASTEVNRRWQTEMAPFFVVDVGRPDENMRVLPLVFQLESQLAALKTTDPE